MTTQIKILQLEKRFIRSDKGKGPMICHKVTYDGRLLDGDGFVMTGEEVRLVAEEDKRNHVGIVVLVRDTDDEEEKPKLKHGSTTVPYHVRSI